MEKGIQDVDIHPLAHEVSSLIDQGRYAVAQTVNSSLTLLYWQIGSSIQTHLLRYDRAVYGRQVVVLLSVHLTAHYGSGWSEKHLRHCIRLVEVYPNLLMSSIVSTVWRQLSWSHIKMLIYMDDPLKRDFYIQMTQMEHWSVRTLQERIQSMLYERTAISRKPEDTIAKDLAHLSDSQQLSPDLVFRDPYVLDFLGLKDTYSEQDLESAILADLQRFIIEFGSDFGFMARQKRITIDNRDYYIDLLFYHRRLKCLVAIDLKLGEFEAGYKGQMELYLRYLEKHLMLEGENLPVGLILCAGKNSEHIELLRLEDSNIRVAEYLTNLPPKALLEAKLHEAIHRARTQFTERNNP